jgi:hypothetical protein
MVIRRRDTVVIFLGQIAYIVGMYHIRIFGFGEDPSGWLEGYAFVVFMLPLFVALMLHLRNRLGLGMAVVLVFLAEAAALIIALRNWGG